MKLAKYRYHSAILLRPSKSPLEISVFFCWVIYGLCLCMNQARRLIRDLTKNDRSVIELQEVRAYGDSAQLYCAAVSSSHGASNATQLEGLTTGLYDFDLIHSWGYVWQVVKFLRLGLVACWLWSKKLRAELCKSTAHVKMVVMGGMALFLLSELALFLSFFMAFFNNLMCPDILHGGFPNRGISLIDPYSIPLTNTCVLLCSGYATTLAHHSLCYGCSSMAKMGMAVAIFWALFFLHLQYIEFAHSKFTMQNGVFASIFYMATGFHGMHVIIGTVLLMINTFRIHRGDYAVEPMNVGWFCGNFYWHFVDLVWIALYMIFYVLMWMGTSPVVRAPVGR